MRVIYMEEGKKSFRLRYPYSRKAVNLLSTLIPAEERKNAFDPATSSWTLPLEYWDDVLSIMEQVYPDVRLHVVEELPPWEPYDPNKEAV